MKASAAIASAARKPPRVLSLPPSAFADTWKDKPAQPVCVGLKRIAEADQRAARVEAAKKADALHPSPTRDDPLWVEAYNQAVMHACLGFAITHPEDITLPLWPLQFDVLPYRLTEGGVERLFDELELLTVLDSPSRPEASDSALVELAELLRSGAFWPGLRVRDDDLAGLDDALRGQALARRRMRLEVQIRRVLAFAIELAAGVPLDEAPVEGAPPAGQPPAGPPVASSTPAFQLPTAPAGPRPAFPPPAAPPPRKPPVGVPAPRASAPKPPRR